MSLNRFERCIVTIGTVALMLGLFWIACSQKTPIDPTSSIQKEVPILANITASPSQVAVGGAQSEIRVQLVDQEGHPLSNEQVTFSTNLGSTTSEDLTDQNGWAVAVLTSGQTPGNARVTARYGKLASVSVTVKFISSYQAQIQINSYRKEILANGVDTTAITITLLGDSAKPVAGAVVSLSRSLGTIPSSVMTGAEGKGKVYLTSIANSQDTTTTVTATYDTLPPVAIVVFFKGIQFSVEANPTSILADGGSKSTIRAILKETSSHIALSDAEIRFGTTLGTIPAVEHTDASGVAEVSLTSGTTPGTAVVVARYGNVLLDTARVAFGQLQYSLDLKSDPDAILANGEETATISATVKDSKGQPVSGLPVKFSATAGIIDSAGATNSSGIAEAVLRSVADSTDILDTVTATVEGVSKTIQVTLQGIRFKLKADPAYIVADGQSQSVITVTLKETTTQVGIVGAHIQFGTTLGKIPAEGITDNQGVVSVPLTSGTVLGIAEVVARYGKTFLDTVPVSFGSSSPATLSAINASPSAILANGVDQSTVIAKVVDSNSNSVSGVVVSFTTTAGTVQSQGITDNNGFATAVLTSSASETDINATVTAHLGTQSVPTTVVFQGVTMELSVSPDTILADGESQSVITVILKRATSNVAISGAEISFGTDHGTIPSSATTNASGIVQVTLTSEATPNTAHVVASYGAGISKTDSVIFVSSLPSGNALSSINASPSAILANGVDQSTVTAKVVDNNLNPVSGVVIGFTTTAGTVQSQSITDNNGFATAVLTSDTSSTDINVIVTAHLDGTPPIQTTVVFQGVTMELSASPGTILADGESQSVITVILKRATSNVAISGAEISFGTDHGTIPSSATTNASGIVQVTLTSEATPNTAHVVASYGAGISKTDSVIFVSSLPSGNALSSINASPSAILANGVDQSTVTAKVVDNNLNPVSGVVIGFTTTAGTVQSQSITDNNGFATAVLTSDTSSTDINATVTAHLGTQSAQTVVVFQGVTMNISASPGTILADGQSQSVITVILKRATSNIAVSGAVITFGTDLGTISNEATTNSGGVAEVSLTSGTATGTAHVVASYGAGISRTTTVVFQESVPSNLEVSATPTVITADGQSQSIIKATVSDANRNPVPDGTLVVFDIAEGSGTIGRQRTTVGGVAATTLTSGTQPDTAKIIGSVGSLADTVMVVYVVGAVDRIEVTADPDSIPADGITTSRIRARVLDTKNNPIEGVTVEFSASVGDIVQSVRTNSEGLAEAEYSSKVVGLATITAEVGGVFGTTSIQVIPGGPYSITITYEPHFIYVRDCGKNQTATIYAEVLDEKNNPVANGTLVKFSIYASPGADSVEGGRLSSKLAIPTVEGVAQVSYISGIRAGASRIRADVTADADGNPVSPSVMGISTEIVIFAGPPYIENINDPSSSHLSVGVEWGKQNMWHWIETSEITVLVGDKYNNPVQEGTAVYLTTSGGVITTKAYTDANGIAKAILQSGNPEPTIDRFYNYIGMQDPNTGAPIGDHDTDPRIKDFEVSRVQNSEGDFGENDGIARIIAYSEGVDSLGNSARAWCENWSVFSRSIYHFDVFSDKTILSPGEFASITIECWDKNGNPVVGGSTLEASAKPADVAELSWTSKTTDDPGSCYYGLTVTNTVNPQDTTAMASWTTVTVKIEGKNGKREAAVQIFCDIK